MHHKVAQIQPALEQKLTQAIIGQSPQTALLALSKAVGEMFQRSAWTLEDIFSLAVEETAVTLAVSRGLLLLFKYADPLHKTRPLKGIPKTRASLVADWLQPGLTESSLRTDQAFWASDCRICQQVLTGQLEPVIVSVDEMLALNLEKRQVQIASVFQLSPAQTLLLVPLDNQGIRLGCLVFQSDQPRSWSFEELAFVKLVAAQLSMAMIQTRTLQQIQGVVQERTAQLQQSLDVQSKLYEKTRQQVVQLRRLNEEREEFLSTVSHELRTPLTTMTVAIRMLRQANLTPDRRNQYLDILEQQCSQETNLINDLLAIRKLECHPLPYRLQRTDLCTLIRNVAQALQTNWTEKRLELDLPQNSVPLYTDVDSLNRILLELLTNAIKYAEPGSAIALAAVREASLNRVILSLRNIGAGILPEELPHIFEKFRRGQGVTQRAVQGTGLGLALVKGLVMHLNGAIMATSQPRACGSAWETCFVLTLPQHPEDLLAVSGP